VGSRELLNLGSSDRAGPRLCLHINEIEPEAIFLDDAVDSFIARLPYGRARVSERAAVTHRDKQLHHHALEKCRRAFLKPI
jgi:hypothetical protein